MLITLRPGVDPITARRALSDVGEKAGNLRSGTADPRDPATEWLLKYLEWATESVQKLRYAISEGDIDRLVLTRRYYALLDGAGRFTGNDQARLVNGLLSLELAERTAAFENAVKTLDDHLDRWTTHPRWFAVADSSFYLNSPDPLGDTDLHQILGLPTGEDIHLLFPIVVVDELDRLKETGKNHARWRAGHTLGLLDEVLRGGTRGTLRPMRLPMGAALSDAPVRGEVTIEIVLDQPGHVRLPIDDDEIIDRAVAIKAIAGREVRLLTCDTGQATRGNIAGLKVTKLPHTAGTGDEPSRDGRGGDHPRGDGTRGRRKDRLEAQMTAASNGAPDEG